MTCNIKLKVTEDKPIVLKTTENIGGSAAVIEHITVNGTEQPVIDKTVDVPVPEAVSELTNDSGYQTAADVATAIAGKADKSEIPTQVSELTNDSDYQTAAEVQAAIAGKADTSDIPTAVSELTNDSGYQTEVEVQATIDDSLPVEATDSTLGLIKTNSAEGVALNSDGQLEVGGRLGQFEGTTGIYYGADRDPRGVADYSLLITDALGMDMRSNRSLAVVSGVGIMISGAHAAGVTEYRVANNYANRILCSSVKYISLDEATSTVERIEPVVSVTIDGRSFTPDSSANDSSNPIIITVANSINPDAPIAASGSIRGFSIMGGYAAAYIGSCVGAATGGASFMLGQGVWSQSGNMNVVLGQYHYNQGNGNTLLGRQHISRKNRWLLAGTGHDTTNGKSEAGAAVGQYSLIDSGTLFAVGNGTDHTARKNALEVRADGIVLLSPNGTRWKIAVDNDGNLTTTAL